jgi:hypothetical protein
MNTGPDGIQTFRALLISSLSGASLGPQDNRGVRENTATGVCVCQRPAWHFCLHKRLNRLSIMLRTTNDGQLLPYPRSIQGPTRIQLPPEP